jgi:hypothetical protein
MNKPKKRKGLTWGLVEEELRKRIKERQKEFKRSGGMEKEWGRLAKREADNLESFYFYLFDEVVPWPFDKPEGGNAGQT